MKVCDRWFYVIVSEWESFSNQKAFIFCLCSFALTKRLTYEKVNASSVTCYHGIRIWLTCACNAFFSLWMTSSIVGRWAWVSTRHRYAISENMSKESLSGPLLRAKTCPPASSFIFWSIILTSVPFSKWCRAMGAIPLLLYLL